VPENVGQASAAIARRVRDPQFQGTTQPQVISLISYSQQVINGILGDLVVSIPLLIQPRTLIYSMSGFLADINDNPLAINVEAVQDASGRDLEPMPDLTYLENLDIQWPVAVADSPRGFCQVGGDLLIIYPAVKTPQTLTVKASAFIAPVVNNGDSTSLPAEDDAAINDLTEIVLLLKNRDLMPLKGVVDRFRKRVAELKEERR
jgi:hypothetical protein